MNEVTIKSTHSDYEIRLSEPNPSRMQTPFEYLRVSIDGHDLTASSSEIYLYESNDLAHFFEDMAKNWKGWEGEKTWNSIEGDFGITATTDGLGHIALRIKLRSGPYAEDWELKICIYIDAGQIEGIAKEVKRFLHTA